MRRYHWCLGLTVRGSAVSVIRASGSRGGVCWAGGVLRWLDRDPDGAGGRHGLGDLLVRGALALTHFRGGHFRQEVEVPFAVDQDWDQHLAVLCEQDALPQSLERNPIPRAKPIAQSRATMLPSSSIMMIGR